MSENKRGVADMRCAAARAAWDPLAIDHFRYLFLAWAVQATARLISAMPRLFFAICGTYVFLDDSK